MDCIMSFVRDGDQILWVEEVVRTVQNILRRQWIHMMNRWVSSNREIMVCHVETIITGDNFKTNVPPLSAMIKTLVKTSLRAEGLGADLSGEVEIVKALLESVEKNEFRICTHMNPVS